jgi:hypothetical protein
MKKAKEKYQGANPYVDDQIRYPEKTGVSGFSNRNIRFLQSEDSQYF